MNKKTIKIASAALLMLLAAGCSQAADKQAADKPEAGKASAPKQAAANEPPPISKDPVTLKFAVAQSWLAPGEMEKYIIEPVKKKYPQITLEVLNLSAADSIEKLIVANQTPDLVMTANPLIHRYTTYKIHEDIMPLVKKYNFDLSKLDQPAVDGVKTASGFNDLIGIPWTMHFHAMYYNKDIFDRFAVAYPKDGMTWDDYVELARKLTREDGGVQYRGLEPDYSYRVASELSLGLVDPKTERAIVNNEGWKKIFELLKTLYSIPGNAGYKFGSAAETEFFKTRTLAMLGGLNRLPFFKDATGMNWDMVQYPQFKEAPNTAMGVDEWILHVTSTSKYKDQAFQVIATVLSEEVQTDMARNGRFPVLTDQKVRDQLGKDLPYLNGKNLKAAFLSKSAKPTELTKYGEAAQGIIAAQSVGALVKGDKDINTILREAEEAINKQIDKQKGK